MLSSADAGFAAQLVQQIHDFEAAGVHPRLGPLFAARDEWPLIEHEGQSAADVEFVESEDVCRNEAYARCKYRSVLHLLPECGDIVSADVDEKVVRHPDEGLHVGAGCVFTLQFQPVSARFQRVEAREAGVGVRRESCVRSRQVKSASSTGMASELADTSTMAMRCSSSLGMSMP